MVSLAICLSTLCGVASAFQALPTTQLPTRLQASPDPSVSPELAPYLPRQVTLGVLCLGGYSYKTNIGDVLDPRSHEFGLVSANVPGLDFDVCKRGYDGKHPGELDKPGSTEVKDALKEATYALLDNGADMITGDCGFMFYFQILIRSFVQEWAAERQETIQPPVMMSSLNLLPNMMQIVPPTKKIMILTAQEESMDELQKNFPKIYEAQLRDELGEDFENCKDQGLVEPIFNLEKLATDARIVIQGIDTLPGPVGVNFNDALNVNSANWPDRRKLAWPVGTAVKALVDADPDIVAFVIECTEAYGFATAIQMQTGLPVFNGNTMVHSLSMGFRMQFQAPAFTPAFTPRVAGGLVSYESTMHSVYPNKP